MEIKLSKYAGFCDGVRRAFDIVMSIDSKAAKPHDQSIGVGVKRPIFVLGSLVHNPEVNKKIEEKGISKIERDEFFNAPTGKIGTIIFTAHGIGPDAYEVAKKKGIDIIDTTCPKVIKVQRLAKIFHEKEYLIIIIGDKDHKEVHGINEWGGGHAFIVSEKKDLVDFTAASDQKIAVLSQTTQNEDFCEEICAFIKEKYSEVEVNITTCDTTRKRQGEIKDLARSHDVAIIIGSKISANSRRLWEIALTLNPRSYFVDNVSEIDRNWFEGAGSVAVTAGASTPSWTIEGVVAYLRNF